MLTTLQSKPACGAYKTFAKRYSAQRNNYLGPPAATIWRNQGVAAMILKLTTNDKASIWVNLSRILQMTLIDAQDGYPKTQIVMDNGAVICVFETSDDIAQWTKAG